MKSEHEKFIDEYAGKLPNLVLEDIKKAFRQTSPRATAAKWWKPSLPPIMPQK